MRYRMELTEGEFIIRNVDMDVKLGTAIPLHFNDPGRPCSCIVLNKDGDEITVIPPITLDRAAGLIANNEAYSGYPGFRDRPEGCPDTHRVEFLLGRVLADAVTVIARALIEYWSGGLKAETKSKFGDLIAQLHDIWYVSRFGSFNGELGTNEPYFAKFGLGEDPRVSFAVAAQQYGMLESQMRFPEESDETLKEVLSWPLALLRDTLDRLSPRRHPL